MADAPIPEVLEPPPRTTGNAQLDFPILMDWIWRAYSVIQQSVAYINAQVSSGGGLDINDLPDPATATISSAQQTANEAFALADEQRDRIDGFVSGTFTIADADDNASVTFDTDQPDDDYRVIVQALNSVGTPDPQAYTVTSKSYLETGFSVTILAAPGSGTSITFEWQLIRNS
jgi:hypothetical protein